MGSGVVSHNPTWKTAFLEEKKTILGVLRGSKVDVHHFGSTAIPGILAKPIIDTMGAVATLAAADQNAGGLEAIGYEALGAYGIEGRRYFRKVNAAGRRTHHPHIFERGALHIERRLAFRDYLVAHRDVAAAYSELKERLANSEYASWDRYITGKDPFIKRIEGEAIAWFRAQTVH